MLSGREVAAIALALEGVTIDGRWRPGRLEFMALESTQIFLMGADL